MEHQHPNTLEKPAGGACLQLPSDLGMAALRRGMGKLGPLRVSRPVRRAYAFYDTFEWGLWFSGRALYRVDGAFELAGCDGGWPGTVEAREVGIDELPRRTADQPPGALRAALAPYMGPRALLPVAEVDAAEQAVELLDQEGKIVFRFDLLSLYDPGRPRARFCWFCRLCPLRGYDREADQALQQLREMGLHDPAGGPLEQTLARHGQIPATHSLRPVFDLTPDEPAREAVRQIVRCMLAIARRQEFGILDDLDTEFLHDYRICLRKVRSILSLLKEIYPPQDTLRLQRICRDLARATNRLRDLDVFILDHHAYREFLPEELQGGLDPLFQALALERAREFRRVRRYLQSATYRNRMKALQAFFTEPDRLPPSAHSAAPILPLASKRIYRRYRRIVREGRKVGRETSESVLHDIRIQGKKLRYLLEYFGELYESEPLDRLVRHLRRLQNRLGKCNDYAVQQEFLVAHWTELRATTPPDVALSVGGLVAVLHQRRHRQQRRAAKALSRFLASDVRRCFRDLFHSRPPGAA